MTPQHLREAALAHRAQLISRGVSVQRADAAAAKLAKSDPRSVRRWVTQAAAAEEGVLPATQDAAGADFVVDDVVRQAIAAHRCLKDAHEDLLANGVPVPGYRQFCRITQKTMHPGVRAALLGDGADAFHDRHLYLVSGKVAGRNAVWQMDSQEVPVRVLAKYGRIVKPWQTSIIDVATRTLMATLITEDRPNSADVKACLAMAIRGVTLVSPSGPVWVGGAPEVLVVDNGGEYISDEVTATCDDLLIALCPTGSYSAWEKGNIERWHKTIQLELYRTFDGYTNGPTSHTKTRYWDPENSAPDRLVSLEMLRIAANEWVEQYNCVRPHSALDGDTPVMCWAADPTVLRPLPDAALLSCWYAAGERKVGKSGIHLHESKWSSEELEGRFGQKLRVSWLPASAPELERVAVWDRDELITICGLAEQMTEVQRRAVLGQRREAYLQLKRAETSATARRRQVTDQVIASGGLPAQRNLAAATQDDLTAQLLDYAAETETAEPTQRDDEDGIGASS